VHNRSKNDENDFDETKKLKQEWSQTMKFECYNTSKRKLGSSNVLFFENARKRSFNPKTKPIAIN
jgi:hypothetical protein